MAPKRKKQTSQMPAYGAQAEIYCSIGNVAVLTREGLLAMARNPRFALDEPRRDRPRGPKWGRVVEASNRSKVGA